MGWRNYGEPALSAPNLNHMDEGIYYNREAVKKLQKAIANADEVDWNVIANAEVYAQTAQAAASEAEASLTIVNEYKTEAANSAASAIVAKEAAERAAQDAAEDARAEVESIARDAAEEVIGSKQDKLTAGSGISIEGNVISATGGGGGGTTDYEQLNNKPQIAGISLVGNKSLADLGIASSSDLEKLAGIVGQANAVLEGV